MLLAAECGPSKCRKPAQTALECNDAGGGTAIQAAIGCVKHGAQAAISKLGNFQLEGSGKTSHARNAVSPVPDPQVSDPLETITYL